MDQIAILFLCGLLAALPGIVLWRESSKRPKGMSATLLRIVSILLLLFATGSVISICYQLNQLRLQ